MTVVSPPASTPQAPSGGLRRADWVVIAAAYLAVVPALIGASFLGFRIGGWAWVIVLLMGVYALAIGPLAPRSMLYAWPLLVWILAAVATFAITIDWFKGIQTLAQITTVFVLYLVAYRAMGDDPDVMLRVRRLATWLLPAGGIVFIRAALGGGLRLGWLQGGSARPMVMGLLLLYAAAAYHRTRKAAFLMGMGAVFLAILSGGRTGSALLLLVVFLYPAVAWRRWQRVAAVVAGFVVLNLVIALPIVQERFFVGSQPGTLIDIVTLSPRFNTAGRANNWPEILAICDDRPLTGFGVGSTGLITLEATDGGTSHPHNEYIRTYCDVGWPAAAAFWVFFIAAGVRGTLLYRRTGEQIGAVAGLVVFSLLGFAITDNVIIYTSIFMAPLAVALGASDRRYAEDADQRRGAHRRASAIEVF